jgi:hypothetical protein
MAPEVLRGVPKSESLAAPSERLIRTFPGETSRWMTLGRLQRRAPPRPRERSGSPGRTLGASVVAPAEELRGRLGGHRCASDPSRRDARALAVKRFRTNRSTSMRVGSTPPALRRARPVKEFPSVATSARRSPARRRSSERRLPLGPPPPCTPRTIGPPRRRVRLPSSRMHPRRRRPARASPDTDRGSRPSAASGARAACSALAVCSRPPSCHAPMLGHRRVTTHHAR